MKKKKKTLEKSNTKKTRTSSINLPKDKKEILRLKAAYKKGALSFDSKTIALSILEEFKKGISKEK